MEFCNACGRNIGTLALVPGLGAYVFCTECRKSLAPEGWHLPCARCGLGITAHVPFGVPDPIKGVCEKFVTPEEEE